IPMRDGAKLNATIFASHGQKEPQPVIFTFTPYIGDSYTDRALYFAKHGYVYALVDVRGRGNSGGEFEPFANESRDGYDVVEWFAKQPYCNGKVTMWGGSYAAFDQWTVLKEFPPPPRIPGWISRSSTTFLALTRCNGSPSRAESRATATFLEAAVFGRATRAKCTWRTRHFKAMTSWWEIRRRCFRNG